MKDLTATIKENKLIAENIYELTLTLPQKTEVKGGQFVNISTGDSSQLLRRPFGVMKAEGNDITLCYQVKGSGTQNLADMKVGQTLEILLPLGNGFDLSGFKKVAVLGGGVGIFPLIATIRANPAIDFYTYAGFRNSAAVCLLDELKKSKRLTVTTDDGSYGCKGNAVQAYLADAAELNPDCIIACGPPVMLKILKQRLEECGNKIPCFVSLEERMGCGIGACLVCVCKTTAGGNARVCKDGPVFDINKVEL